ncbi:hypothetical protein CPB85DRAFT_1265801 [Mucidula mucida]|nr:hypothetical protein CPB85DRAFT_1265801 [Mucidula mucida]
MSFFDPSPSHLPPSVSQPTGLILPPTSPSTAPVCRAAHLAVSLLVIVSTPIDIDCRRSSCTLLQ